MRPARSQLKSLRHSIRRLDAKIVQALAGRMVLARRMGKIKAHLGLPLVNRNVETRVVRRAIDEAVRRKLNPRFATRLMTLVIKETRSLERRVIYESRRQVGKRAKTRRRRF